MIKNLWVVYRVLGWSTGLSLSYVGKEMVEIWLELGLEMWVRADCRVWRVRQRTSRQLL